MSLLVLLGLPGAPAGQQMFFGRTPLAALGCFCGRGRPSRKRHKNCLSRCVRLFLRAGGPAERETPKTFYLAALSCFCGPGPGRAGNAKNCLSRCVRLFLRAGGSAEQETAKTLLLCLLHFGGWVGWAWWLAQCMLLWLQTYSWNPNNRHHPNHQPATAVILTAYWNVQPPSARARLCNRLLFVAHGARPVEGEVL